MKINKIVLYNFNSYEGLNEFDFTSDDSSKNIILIGGKNGAGKTSLFTAIKIALYGPLAFGYVGVNPTYIARIKECFNSKSFQKDVVKSSVQISVSLMIEREVREYEITREWDYTQKKLEERYYVKTAGHLLDEQELSYFQNYLQGMIPPDLFEFFLFDGEEVGSIFSTSKYNSYIKNAVYTLCGLDIFEIIEKYMTRYAGNASNKYEEEIYSQYDEMRRKSDVIERNYVKLEQKIIVARNDLQKVETELCEVETAFKNAGGITKLERQALIKELSEAEKTKTESRTKIKMFVEGLMPFFILRDFTGRISKQLDFEEKKEIFYYIQHKLNHQEIKKALNENKEVSDDTVEVLIELLLKKFRPKGFKEDVQSVHDLSKEELGRVNATISLIDDFDIKSMVALVKRRMVAADRTMEINRILKNTLSKDEADKFLERENTLLKKKDEITSRIHEFEMRLTSMKEELASVVLQREHAFKIIKDNAQNKHVFELSMGLSRMMGEMLKRKAESIKCHLEKLIVENLQHIYRKDNLITYIKIEKDFNFNLYQNAEYSNTELLHLIKNLGKERFVLEIGKYGMSLLCEKYKVETVSQLSQALEADTQKNNHDLFKRIDINRLSKGERQIFILSLYWAIIKLSGKEIPFVIDTPYARIDADHRKEISKKFFPNISKQVVILSTDEEINEEYYDIIQPYIAKEYLLTNDESQNRTTVKQHYFFRGVGSDI